ncbi:MAG: GNAT family N-acetyltransferase [Acetatifactor sp.]|nr:GNAT family N-acetyltransferase [Acetatifactor sp.]
MNLNVKFFDELTLAELYEILKSRAEVFMLEQNIKCQDMDDIDYKSIHCFFWEDNRVTAYLRAYYKDDNTDIVHIGRVFTLRHGIGLGRELMIDSVKAIKEKTQCQKICMDAQNHAVGFYEKLGFQVTSDEFLEEGIAHVAMELEL